MDPEAAQFEEVDGGDRQSARQARIALKQIVDEYDPPALSRPVMSNLLKDLLPDAPQIARMLVAAAEDQVAEVLQEHVAQGLDSITAVGLAASSFAAATMFSPEACRWVASEPAVALGILTGDAIPAIGDLTTAASAC